MATRSNVWMPAVAVTFASDWCVSTNHRESFHTASLYLGIACTGG
jgi:hypothetical protein